MPTYNIFLCNRCLDMDFSYFDHCVHRYCKAYGVPLNGMTNLTENKSCPKFNKAKKGRKGKATFLRKDDYLKRYPE